MKPEIMITQCCICHKTKMTDGSWDYLTSFEQYIVIINAGKITYNWIKCPKCEVANEKKE